MEGCADSAELRFEEWGIFYKGLKKLDVFSEEKAPKIAEEIKRTPNSKLSVGKTVSVVTLLRTRVFLPRNFQCREMRSWWSMPLAQRGKSQAPGGHLQGAPSKVAERCAPQQCKSGTHRLRGFWGIRAWRVLL